MTKKQQLFCEYYIESLNATQSAIRAGYSKKTAQKIAAENLTKPVIKNYIDKQMQLKLGDIMASQDEILSMLSSILRGDKFIEVSYVDKLTGKLKTYKKYPGFAEMIKAAELLGKRYNMWSDKQVIDVSDTDIHVTIE